MDEAELIQKIKDGEEHAFEELYDQYQRQAFRTVCFITGNASTSEDIVQEAFVQCFLQIHQLKDSSCFRPWFYKILTRLAWKGSNKDKEAVPVEEIFDLAENIRSEDSSDICVKKEESRQLLRAVNSLEKKQRIPVVLFYYNDMSISEIARIMGCMEGTVKSRLHFARKKLYKMLSPDTVFSGKVCERHE